MRGKRSLGGSLVKRSLGEFFFLGSAFFFFGAGFLGALTATMLPDFGSKSIRLLVVGPRLRSS